MAGVKEYFNVMLGTQLLYKFERPQYSEVSLYQLVIQVDNAFHMWHWYI